MWSPTRSATWRPRAGAAWPPVLALLLLAAGSLTSAHGREMSGGPGLAMPASAGGAADGDSWRSQVAPSCRVSLDGGPSRDALPWNFTFGVSTSAYQVEGAALEDGRGPCIWDVFARQPGKVADNSTADVTCDQYHKYKDDVALIKWLGMDAYRFSISWSRVMPDGRGRVNAKGVEYYHNLIDELLRQGIQPIVVLYHWDLPAALFEDGLGWLNPDIVSAFEAYADLCFREFGGRVKTWATFNEAGDTCVRGYGSGVNAPGRCSDRHVCGAGDTATEPYVAGHNMLRSHAAAVALYRAKYQAAQGGRIGIIVNCVYHYPASDTPEARLAAEWGMLFMFGWFFDPVWTGDYPPVMRDHVGGRLPRFTPREAALLRGSADFVGLNFYTAVFADMGAPPAPAARAPTTDGWVISSTKDAEGVDIGAATASPWVKVTPGAMREMLMWLSGRYPGMPIIVSENGMADPAGLPVEVALCDRQRLGFYQEYLSNVALAVRDGAKVEGYFVWSMMDNFEWASGYQERFGIVYVDFERPDRPRFPKASAHWWHRFMSKQTETV